MSTKHQTSVAARLHAAQELWNAGRITFKQVLEMLGDIPLGIHDREPKDEKPKLRLIQGGKP